jgi:hypothetical protein
MILTHSFKIEAKIKTTKQQKIIQMTKAELWLRLKNYHFDHIVPPMIWENVVEFFGGANASTKAFADKVARKHNWKVSYTMKAINEYKKFVYLAVVSDFHVTPSKIIDVIWHEHLLFSKAYRTFCNEVIEYVFDHHPELMPMEDQTGRFTAQYEETLKLYEHEFAVTPPAAVWGQTKYDELELETYNYKARKKGSETDVYLSSNSYSSDSSLYTYFDGNADNPEFSSSEYSDFDGGGAGGDWSDAPGNDSGDSGDSGDGGSGDGGGCSGSCGGGCGGD